MTHTQITTDHLDAALKSVAMHTDGKYSIVDVFNLAQEIVETSTQPDNLITADEARKLGSGKAEYRYRRLLSSWKWYAWIECSASFEESTPTWEVQYRAIQPQAQPVQPADKDIEIARLTACLKTANASSEKFEREWYLRGDEIEAMQAQPIQPSPTPVSHSQIAYEMALALVDHLAVQPAKPVQPKERQPLSVLEVEQILNQHDYNVHGDRARYIVRMTEAAHGIGEKT